MSDRIKFVLDGCDISFTAEAPADMTLAQLLKQADRIKPDWCACGIRSKTPDDYDKTEIIFDYDDVRKTDDDVSCRIKKIYLYHVTKPENVQSILQTGLRRDSGGRRTIAIYLSENPRSWYQPGKVVLRVLIEGLTGDMTTFLPEQDEILYWGDIEPERIEVWKGEGHGEQSGGI